MASRLLELKKKWLPKADSSQQQTPAVTQQPSATQQSVTHAKPGMSAAAAFASTFPTNKRVSGTATPREEEVSKRERIEQVMPVATLKAGIPLGRGRRSFRASASSETTSQPTAPMTQVAVDRGFTVHDLIKVNQEWLKSACGADAVVFSSRSSYKFNKKDYREVCEFIEALKATQPSLFA